MAAFVLISAWLMFVFYSTALMGKYHPGLTEMRIGFCIYSSFTNKEHGKKYVAEGLSGKTTITLINCLAQASEFYVSYNMSHIFVFVSLFRG